MCWFKVVNSITFPFNSLDRNVLCWGRYQRDQRLGLCPCLLCLCAICESFWTDIYHKQKWLDRNHQATMEKACWDRITESFSPEGAHPMRQDMSSPPRKHILLQLASTHNTSRHSCHWHCHYVIHSYSMSFVCTLWTHTRVMTKSTETVQNTESWIQEAFLKPALSVL